MISLIKCRACLSFISMLPNDVFIFVNKTEWLTIAVVSSSKKNLYFSFRQLSRPYSSYPLYLRCPWTPTILAFFIPPSIENPKKVSNASYYVSNLTQHTRQVPFVSDPAVSHFNSFRWSGLTHANPLIQNLSSQHYGHRTTVTTNQTKTYWIYNNFII